MSKLLARIQDNFNLNGVDQVYFWKSEWEHFDPQDRLCTVSIGYLIYRFLFATFFICSTIYSLTCADMSYYFIFLTNWSFTFQLIYSTFYLIRLIWVRIERREIEARLFTASTSGFSQQPRLPWPEKIIWIFINIVSLIPYSVTFFFWIFVYNTAKWSTIGTCKSVVNVVTHALNSIMALLDLGVMAVPIRISHMIFPVIFAICYCSFSGFYEVSGGTYVNDEEYIYSILDWRHNPGLAIGTTFGGIIFVILGHAMAVWGIYRLRVLAVNRYFSRGQQKPAISAENINNTTISSNNFAYSNATLGDDDETKESQTSTNLKFEPDVEVGYQSQSPQV